MEAPLTHSVADPSLLQKRTNQAANKMGVAVWQKGGPAQFTAGWVGRSLAVSAGRPPPVRLRPFVVVGVGQGRRLRLMSTAADFVLRPRAPFQRRRSGGLVASQPSHFDQYSSICRRKSGVGTRGASHALFLVFAVRSLGL